MNSSFDTDTIVRAYASFLASCWQTVEKLAATATTGSYLQDFLQANWEMLVEGAMPPGEVFLEFYGDGADCNGTSSRVYAPEVAATHAVVCVPASPESVIEDLLTGERMSFVTAGIPLEEFVAMDGTWFERRPPFDCVLLDDDGRQRVVATKAIRFELGPATT